MTQLRNYFRVTARSSTMKSRTYYVRVYHCHLLTYAKRLAILALTQYLLACGHSHIRVNTPIHVSNELNDHHTIVYDTNTCEDVWIDEQTLTKGY